MKIGIVGLGSIGRRHANNLKAMGHEVYAYDPAFPNGLANIKPMAAAMDGIDGYVICTPTKQHMADMETYLQTGKPLFVEKPITDTANISITNQIKMVGYNLRYHACVEAARRWLNADEIGQILWGQFTVAQYNDKKDYRRDGVVLNWSHEIDLALHLLGPADVKASSVKLENDQDVIADICLRHSNSDAPSVVHLDYLTRPELRQSIIIGAEGQIILDLVSRNAWLRDTRGGVLDHVEAHDSFDMNYREEIDDFICLIAGKTGTGQHCTAYQAIAVLNICMEVRKQAGL